MDAIRVGLLGCGTVGTGVVRLLAESGPDIQARLGVPLEIARIAVRDPSRQRDPAVPRDKLTADAREVLDDPDVQIVVEIAGGYEPARTWALAALERGKHLVTANKALLARHGAELARAAAAAGADLHFEAAVGGGIPIIRSLREALASDRIEQIAAIINGTSNYVLTAMSEQGWSFEQATRRAQELGYAEADASLDTGGHDAAQKLAVLTMLAFGLRAPAEAILTEGIESIEPIDVQLAQRFGYAIRPLAFARAHGDSVEARVHPALVPHSGLLASVSGVFNAVHIHSHALGPALLYGQGAGMMPTAMSVVSDIIEAARTVRLGVAGRLPHLAYHDELLGERHLLPSGDCRSAFYLRLRVDDQPGVLAQVAGALGRGSVSIRQLVQLEPDEAGHATLALLTHEARQADVDEALAAIDDLDVCAAPSHAIRIVEV